MPNTTYHLLTEAEPFSEFHGGAISRWAGNVLRDTSNSVVVCPSADDTWKFPPKSILLLPALERYRRWRRMAQRLPWSLRRPVILGYREERVTLGGLSKLLRLQYVCTQLGPGAWRKLRLIVNPAARFAANCVSVPGGEPRMDHLAIQATFAAEPAKWRNLWTLLAVLYGRSCSETFQPAPLLQQARSRHWSA